MLFMTHLPSWSTRVVKHSTFLRHKGFRRCWFMVAPLKHCLRVRSHFRSIEKTLEVCICLKPLLNYMPAFLHSERFHKNIFQFWRSSRLCKLRHMRFFDDIHQHGGSGSMKVGLAIRVPCQFSTRTFSFLRRKLNSEFSHRICPENVSYSRLKIATLFLRWCVLVHCSSSLHKSRVAHSPIKLDIFSSSCLFSSATYFLLKGIVYSILWLLRREYVALLWFCRSKNRNSCDDLFERKEKELLEVSSGVNQRRKMCFTHACIWTFSWARLFNMLGNKFQILNEQIASVLMRWNSCSFWSSLPLY